MTITPSHWGSIEQDLPRIWRACQEADSINEERRLPAPCAEFEAKFDQVAAYNLSALALERLMARCGDIFWPRQIGQLALVQHQPSLSLLRVGAHDAKGRVSRDLRDEEIGADLKRFRDQEPMFEGFEETVHLWVGLGPFQARAPRPVFIAEYNGLTPVHILHIAAPTVETRVAAWDTATSTANLDIMLQRIA